MLRKIVDQNYIKSTFRVKPQAEKLSYILLDTRFIHLGDNMNFNLFFQNKQEKMSLLLRSDTIINEYLLDKLQKIEQVYVSLVDKNKYEYFIENHLQTLLKDTSLTIDEKTDLIYASSSELTQSLYDNPNALENAQRSKNIITPILQSIIYHDDTIASYIKIIEYDYYTHTHSLNVSIYALCLGAELGLLDDELTSLGRAALLHDLGKSKIEYELVNKNGELSIDEFQEMKMHPLFGYDIAVNIGIDNQEILDGIRHHHEKLDGNGYPDGLKAYEITLFPRIISICDIFDALTTTRSYKPAMTSFQTLQLMKKEMETHLDMQILDTFIKMLHK